jgi:MoaA/NifB/PqqE/SkfB family radical SAM enzyme
LKKIPPTIVNEKGIRFLHGLSIKYSCFSMFNFCLLKCNGDIVPCFDMWNYKIGNIREKTPSSIWESKDAKEGRRKVKKCKGCLSNCALPWSYGASFFPRVLFNLKHPGILLGKFTKSI